MSQTAPIPRCDVSIRPATLADVPFIDSLQKNYRRRLGFMRTSWLEQRVGAGQVLVAEEVGSSELVVGSAEQTCSLPTTNYQPPTPQGYIISQDKYNKREELGLVVQLCVAPGAQRKLIGATLLKAAFDHAAYGCRLFCCWCAQDIEANRFWESVGFVPLAYRAGSEKKRKGGRVHIFWQKRIRQGDVATPWWYPTETTGGAIGEGRIVLPIPPGKHWSDELPTLLPREQLPVARSQLPGKKRLALPSLTTGNRQLATSVPKPQAITRSSGLRFGPAPEAVSEQKPKEKKAPEKRVRPKNDTKLVAAARELRDRWLEHVNAGGSLLESAGKYDVARVLPAAPPTTSALELSHAPSRRKALRQAA